MLKLQTLTLALFAVFPGGAALAGDAIPNWPAPATWSPAKTHGLGAMDVTNPLPFIGLAPCRIADTRNAPGPYGAPALSGGVPRNFTLTGVCGIPASAGAVSLNVTVTNTQGPGFILIYPAGGMQPTVSTLNYVAGQTIANAAVVPLGGGSITVIAGVSGTDLILDTNGYYYGGSASLASGEKFTLVGDVAGAGTGVLSVHNTESAMGQVRAGYFLADSSGFGSVAIAAYESAGSGLTAGVYGQASSTTGDTAGVSGIAVATTGRVYGIRGQSYSTSQNSAGVFGVDSDGPTNVSTVPVGVRGESKSGTGVLGVSKAAAISGVLVDSAGGTVAVGYLGSAYLLANDATGGPWGVFASGNIGASGAKHFVEPHPSDPTRVIVYSSLEGREVGTYFRGTSRTVGRRAVVEVPEDFRVVTDEEGLTVQLTPVGPLTTMSVESEDLNRIVVRASQDVTFHYLVQGVRRAFKDFEPMTKSGEFAPRSAEETMPAYLTEEAKRRLISNGTYNPDGTVNMETAERLGWAKAWREREEQATAAAAGKAATLPGGLAERK